MRLIDANELKEELESFSMKINGIRNGKVFLSEYIPEYKKSIIKIIDEQPTVKAGSKWIPCSERMPEVVTGNFLICLKNGFVCIGNYASYRNTFREISSMGMSDFHRENPVIAWMPLPDPYKGN